MSDEGRSLAGQGKHTVTVRVALGKCVWSSAASWLPLANALDGVPPDVAALDEFVNARAEFADKRNDTMATLRAEMARGCSVRDGAGGQGSWDHSKISTTAG